MANLGSPENRSCSAESGSLSSPRQPVPAGGSAARGSSQFGWPMRLLLVGVAGGLIALLGITRWLQPDARGFGTHQQLGMPECTFLTLTGHPCPSCGMTTSWAYLVRGEIGSAVRANAGGALLGLAAIVAIAWSLASAAQGRPVAQQYIQSTIVAVALAVLAAALLPWLGRMVFG